MCDIRISAEGALFAESSVKLGIVPGNGAWLLPRMIGMARASSFLPKTAIVLHLNEGSYREP